MGQGFPTKLEYSNNGLQCIGPGFVVNGLVSEFCPNNVTISFETARLIMRRSETSVRFPNGFPRLLGRCISCESQYELNQFFRKKTAAKWQMGRRTAISVVASSQSGLHRDIAGLIYTHIRRKIGSIPWSKSTYKQQQPGNGKQAPKYSRRGVHSRQWYEANYHLEL